MAVIEQLPEALVGAQIKVFLPGETPWATCVAVHPDGSWDGKINNKLFTEYSEHERAQFTKSTFGTVRPLPILHDFREGQVVRFRRETTDDYEIWVPAEPMKQTKGER